MNKVHDGRLSMMGDFKPSHQDNVKWTPSKWLFPYYGAEDGFDVVANVMAIGEPDKTRASGEVSYYLTDQNNKHILYEGENSLYVQIKASVPRAGENHFSCTIRKDNGLGTEVTDSPYACDVNLRSSDRFDPKPEFTIRKKEVKTSPSKDFSAHLLKTYCVDLNSKACKYTQTSPTTKKWVTDWRQITPLFHNMSARPSFEKVEEVFSLEYRDTTSVELGAKLSIADYVEAGLRASSKIEMRRTTSTSVTTKLEVPANSIAALYARGSMQTVHGSFVIDDGKNIYNLPNIDADLPMSGEAEIVSVPHGVCEPGNCIANPIPSFDDRTRITNGVKEVVK